MDQQARRRRIRLLASGALGGGGGLSQAQILANYAISLNPLLYFKLNETSGTTITNYGSLGAPQNGTWVPGAGALAQTGQLGAGQAVSYDALATNITVSASASMDGIAKYTWAFLCKPNGAGEGNSGRFYNFGNSSTVAATNVNKAVVTVQSATGNAASTSASNLLTLGAWHWVFVQYDDTSDRKIHIFVGIGGVVTEASYTTNTAATGTLTNTGLPLNIGNRGAVDNTWDGLFDEVLFFNKVLSAAEMLQLTSLAGL